MRKTAKLMLQLLPGTDFVTSGYSLMPRQDNLFGGGNFDSNDLDAWTAVQRDLGIDQVAGEAHGHPENEQHAADERDALGQHARQVRAGERRAQFAAPAQRLVIAAAVDHGISRFALGIEEHDLVADRHRARLASLADDPVVGTLVATLAERATEP